MIEAPTLLELIDKRAAETPDAPMTIDEWRSTLTFAAYKDAVERVAAGFGAMGLTTGDVVTWALPTTNNALVLVGALSRLGVIQNPVIPIYREREFGFIAREAKPKLLIVPTEFRGFDFKSMAEKIASENPGLEVLIADDELPEGDPSTLPPAPTGHGDEVRWIFYTSGSTADPKGAKHTDQTIIAAATGMAERLEIAPEDKNGLVFPFTHIAGPIWLCAGLQAGLCHLIVKAFDPPNTVAFFKEQNVTIAGSGTMFHMAYIEAQRATPDDKVFPSVRLFPGGGAPKPPQLHYDIKKEMGAGIVSGYGLTEAPIITMGAADDPDETLANTEGRPMNGVEIVIVDGEIRTKAPQVMKGYVNAELDKDAFDENGYFRTGDLGQLNDGYIVITGRVKDIIIRKGENISAKEVEDLLFTHPKVADAAVIGLPDPSSGERACAVVVSKVAGDDLTMDDMKDFLKDKGLRMQAIPEQLEIVDALPRNPAGKVLKQDLRKVYS